MRVSASTCNPWLAAALAAAMLALAACSEGVAVPTYEVVRRDFVHRVTAEGFLRPTQVTQVTVPFEAPAGARILWRAEDGIEVERGAVVALLDRVEVERRVQKEEVDLATADVRRDRTRIEGDARVDEVGTRLQMAELDVEHAERFPRADRNIFSRREILQSEIDQELARVRQDGAGDIQKLQRDLAATELQLVDLDRRRAADEVKRARRALDALEVRAPQAGLLSWVRNDRGDLPQIGEQVWRGQTLAEMPRLSDLGVEVFVVEADVGGIAPGSEALVTIDAHSDLSHRARVSRVDPVASRRFRGSPVLYFQILLELESVDLRVMKPGQRVSATILVEEVANALVVPRQALFSEADGYVVYRVEDGALERTPVAVSAVARGLAVVSSGLEAGARIALAAPANEPAARGLRRALSSFMGRS
jgi:multidrug resistance efflux pump